MENILIVVSLILIIGLAAFYVYKAKKSGSKCIGCHAGCSCGGEKNNCGCTEEKEGE